MHRAEEEPIEADFPTAVMPSPSIGSARAGTGGGGGGGGGGVPSGGDVVEPSSVLDTISLADLFQPASFLKPPSALEQGFLRSYFLGSDRRAPIIDEAKFYVALAAMMNDRP